MQRRSVAAGKMSCVANEEQASYSSVGRASDCRHCRYQKVPGSVPGGQIMHTGGKCRATWHENPAKENMRHRRDSSPCGQSPMDFSSISLATRTQCLTVWASVAMTRCWISEGMWPPDAIFCRLNWSTIPIHSSRDSLPEWSKGVDSSSTSSNPTAVMACLHLLCKCG